MSENRIRSDSLRLKDNISLKLDVFEGPLDLLMHLIEKNKVNICDIPIALITEQYIAYVDSYKNLDLDNISEFLSLASQLLYIKSRMLLPSAENEDDPREPLVDKIKEYLKYKESAEDLKLRLGSVGNQYTKEQEAIEFDSTYDKNHSVDELHMAYASIFKKSMRRIPPPIESFSGIVGTKIVSVGSKVIFILRNLFSRKSVKFISLFKSQKSRSEIVATFLAVLELSRNGRVSVNGENENITVVLNEKG